MAILAERLVVEVVLDLPLEEVRLTDEEAGAACGLDEALGPFRVARVADHPLAVLDAQGISGRTARVLDDERGHPGRPDQGRLALSKFDKLDGEAAVHLGGAREEDLHRRLDALPDSGRSADDERPCAAAELAIKDEKRQASEMIAVQVGQQDVPDLGWVQAGPLQRNQRRSPAIDQDGLARPGEVEAGLEPAPAAEGIT